MSDKKQINVGGIGVTRDETLKAYLQTCCAIVYYDGTGLKGLAHAVVPSELEEIYRLPGGIEENFIITPKTAAQRLLEEMIKEGAKKEDISAGIFGCSSEIYLGSENAREGNRAVLELGIPLKYPASAALYNTDLTLNTTDILVKSLEVGSRNLVINETHLPYY